MRIARFVLASLALFATSTLANPMGKELPPMPAVVPNEPATPAKPTMIPPSSWGGPTSIPTLPWQVSTVPPATRPSTPSPSNGMPTVRPPGDHHGHDHYEPTQSQKVQVQSSQHYCHKYLEHVACRQCVTVKGSLGYTPNSDLHWCPTVGRDHYDHLGACQLISSPCTSSLSIPITNVTSCPNDPAPSKPSCGACTSDAYVWCQSDDKFDDEYMGVCKDASKLFPSRASAEYALRQRASRDEYSNVYDVIDQLCGPTHTAILTRKECPHKHRFGRGGFIMAVLFHMIPILLCLSACCLCVRAIKRRRASRRQALLDVSAIPSAPTSSSDYPGTVSTTYATDAPLPVPLPNGTYVAPAATAPTAAVPMQVYPTLSTPSGLRAPLLNNGSINSDGLIYGYPTGTGYQRVHQEI